MRGICSIIGLVAITMLCAVTADAQSITRPTFKALQEIQKLVEADKPVEAQRLLEVLVTQTTELPYDNAIANQYLAHTSIMLEQPQRARTALESALDTTELPPDLRTELNLFYGTVLMGEEEFLLAQPVLEEWLAATTSPKPGHVFSVAYANYKIANPARAETLLAQALELSPAPPDSWYQLYYQVLFDQKKYQRAERTLHAMLTRAPGNKQLWRLLANHHLQLEHSGEALATIMVSYLNELVTTPEELRQVVSMFSYMDIPDKGARLLQQWLDDGRLQADVETVRLLGNLWLMARERENAKVVLKQSAQLAPDGDTYELLAGIYFEDEDWAEAYTAYREALRMGKLKEPYRVQFLAGVSAMRAGQKDNARTAFKAAAKSSEFRKQANNLLRNLDKN